MGSDAWICALLRRAWQRRPGSISLVLSGCAGQGALKPTRSHRRGQRRLVGESLSRRLRGDRLRQRASSQAGACTPRWCWGSGTRTRFSTRLLAATAGPATASRSRKRRSGFARRPITPYQVHARAGQRQQPVLGLDRGSSDRQGSRRDDASCRPFLLTYRPRYTVTQVSRKPGMRCCCLFAGELARERFARPQPLPLIADPHAGRSRRTAKTSRACRWPTSPSAALDDERRTQIFPGEAHLATRAAEPFRVRSAAVTRRP